jgi:hypothetical protein
MLGSKLKPSGLLFLIPEGLSEVIESDGKTGGFFCLDEVFVAFHIYHHKTLADIIAYTSRSLRR